MALIKCIECGKEISDNAETCPNCGFKLDLDAKAKGYQMMKEKNKKEEKHKNDFGLLALFLAVLVPFVGFVMGIIGAVKGKTYCLIAILVSIFSFIAYCMFLSNFLQGMY